MRVNGFYSKPIHVSSGVPQGSHLGPLLFVLFINDLVSYIQHCKILLYADDVKIFAPVESVLDCSKIQKDLLQIQLWSDTNDLSLNLDKCKIISFFRNKNHYLRYDYQITGKSIEHVSSIYDLGVIFDTKLNFNDHTNHITSRARSLIGFIFRNSRQFKNVSTLQCLFRSLITSILSYASSIWSPYTKSGIEKIEKVQHTLIRQLSFKIGEPMHKFDHNYDHLYTKFNLHPIKCLHKYNDLVMVYKILNDSNNYLPEELKQLFSYRNDIQYSLRGRRKLIEKSYNYNATYESPVARLRKYWNDFSFNNDIQVRISQFKSLAKLYCFVH